MAEEAIGVATGASVFKSILGFEAADAENQALEEQKIENKVAANDQLIQRQNSLKKIIGGQIVASAALGITPTSGSIQTLQVDTFNKAAEDEELAGLELDVENENIDRKIRNNKDKAWIGAFDNLFGAAKFISGIPDVGAQPGGFQIWGPSGTLAGSFKEKEKSQFGGNV